MPQLEQKCLELEKGLEENLNAYATLEDSEKKQIIGLHIDQHKRTLTILWELRGTEILEVKKEIQRNDWLIDSLDEQLRDAGLKIISKHREVNKFSLFSRSKPDLAFFKSWFYSSTRKNSHTWNCSRVQNK